VDLKIEQKWEFFANHAVFGGDLTQFLTRVLDPELHPAQTVHVFRYRHWWIASCQLFNDQVFFACRFEFETS
jgi:hypothetical protein